MEEMEQAARSHPQAGAEARRQRRGPPRYRRWYVAINAFPRAQFPLLTDLRKVRTRREASIRGTTKHTKDTKMHLQVLSRRTKAPRFFFVSFVCFVVVHF